MDHRLLVRVLHALTDLDKKLETLPVGQLLAVAVLGEGHALDVLHDEVGPSPGCRAGIEDLGDGGVVHHRQSLALGLEAGDDLLGSLDAIHG